VPTGATFPSGRPFLHLDRIAHSHDLEMEQLALPPSRAPHASDHLPLLAELRWL
jgi:endonuclease/exonuclease/phosphatase family metal-dependent hydrolase